MDAPPDTPARARPADAFDTLPALSYWLPHNHEPAAHWTHEAYRNASGNCVTIHYCTDRITSERIAKQFLACPVVGFDMEWAVWGAKGLKGNISLIQVASEDTIALFHIARFQGDTVNDLLCPSLRKLIEDENILKCGVAINNADGSRLRKYMKLKPRGLFELSHFHRVVKWGKRDPSKVNKRLIKLTHLAQEHLGAPLHKGKVRTSDWTKPLTEEQIKYAAADAYSGFRIFHSIEAQRLKLTPPIPPRPAPTELGLPLPCAVDEDVEADEKESDPSKNHASVEEDNGSIPTTSERKTRSGFKIPTQYEFPSDSKTRAGSKSLATSQTPPTFETPAPGALPHAEVYARRTFSAMCALRKRLSLKLKEPEQNLVKGSVLLKLAESRPKCADDLDGEGKTWADLVWTYGQIDLISFLQKHAPREDDKDGRKNSDLHESSENREGPTSGPAADVESPIKSPKSKTPAPEIQPIIIDDDYENYFSSDDFDDDYKGDEDAGDETEYDFIDSEESDNENKNQENDEIDELLTSFGQDTDGLSQV